MRVGLSFAALIAIVIGLWWVAIVERPAPSGAVREPALASSGGAAAPVASPAALEAPRANVVAQGPPPGAAEARPADAPREPAAAPTLAPPRQGPVEELSQRFETEPRASSAGEIERHVEAAFRDPTIPTNTLKSVVCRQTVCRLEVRWTEQSYAAYVLGLTRAVATFSDALAIEPGEPEPNGARLLKVYWGRTTVPAQ